MITKKLLLTPRKTVYLVVAVLALFSWMTIDEYDEISSDGSPMLLGVDAKPKYAYYKPSKSSYKPSKSSSYKKYKVKYKTYKTYRYSYSRYGRSHSYWSFGYSYYDNYHHRTQSGGGGAWILLCLCSCCFCIGGCCLVFFGICALPFAGRHSSSSHSHHSEGGEKLIYLADGPKNHKKPLLNMA